MPDQDKLILSRETAEHLLKGISFFKENPVAKEWQNLDKDLFVFLCRELCQLPVEEEENLNDYLVRLEDFLKKIVNEELTAPSLPQNLEELVEAWEKFLAQKDAQAPPPPKINLPTIEDWIKTLQEKRVQEEVAPQVEKALETAAPHLSSQDKAVLEEKISEEIAKTPFLTLPREEKEAVAQKVVEKSLEEKQILLGEEQRQLLTKAMVSPAPTLPPKERVVREIITPPVFKNFQEQIKETLSVSLEKVEPETINEVGPIVSEALAANLPFLTPQELAGLNPSEKSEIVENTIEAALPDIGEFLVAKEINLSPQETANFLDQLTIATNDNLEKLTIVPPENRLPQEKITKTEGSATPALAALLHPRQTTTLLFNPQSRRNLEALDKNPSLPFSLTAEGEEASPGEKIKNIFLQKGINFQSVNLVKPLKEETESLILAAKGITSADLSLAIKTSREENRPVEEISKLEQLFVRQLDFEKKFPQLAQKFYRLRRAREVVSSQKNDQKLPSWPFAQIKSQINLETTRWNFLRTANRFLEKIGLVKKEESPSGKIIQSSPVWYYPQKIGQAISSFWQKTGVGKAVKSWFSQQTHRFWRSALGQIRGFSKTGVKKAAQEGAKKGVTKAITWLSTKLAATKLGAALGSIAPGIGNAVGAVVGFVVDIGISLFKKGGEFLEKLTGGQTEAEQKLKAALGPFSFLVSPLVLIFIIALGAPLILVFLTVTNIGGAFLSPAGGEEFVPPGNSLPPNINGHLSEQLVQMFINCGLGNPERENATISVNKGSLSRFIDCIENSDLDPWQKNALSDRFESNTNKFYYFQCVGFVFGVEAIQGRTMPSNDVCWATANQWGKEECYKNSPEYEFLGNDCSGVQPGTIAVWFGSTTGHIGIITGIEEEEEVGERRFRFTSAWGNNGIIDIRSFPCSQFDAFIRPR